MPCLYYRQIFNDPVDEHVSGWIVHMLIAMS